MILLILTLLLIQTVSVSSQCQKDFDLYLNFWQLRFEKEKVMGIPEPEGNVDFVVGVRPEESFDVDYYVYTSYKTIGSPGDVLYVPSTDPDKYGYAYAPYFVVSLTNEELENLEDYYHPTNPDNGEIISIQLIRQKIIRRDIEKLHEELTVSHPEWYPYGTELFFGVEADNELNILLDENGMPIPTRPLEDYQQGKTIVTPTVYNESGSTRLHLNLNNPTVREYVIRYALKRLDNWQDNLLYIDNAFIHRHQICPDWICETTLLNYISSGNEENQIMVYANHSNYIFSEIKKRRNPQIILNGFGARQSRPARLMFINYLMENGTDNFDGVLMENQFWSNDKFYPDGFREYRVTDIEYYWEWVQKFKQHNKKFLFTASKIDSYISTDDGFLEDLWLWFHLIADDNTYFHITPSEYMTPMEHYEIYDWHLGRPLENPHKKGDTWYRRYERGNITFNTNSGRLDAIEFAENECNHVLPECGNGIIESGEECDLPQLGATCQSLGFEKGTLACNPDCTLDTSGCTSCTPSPETCNNLDDDCDGIPDNGITCECTEGQTRPCGTTDTGECEYGTQTCINGNWSECAGATEPSEEICDGKDNNCDGQVDENLTDTCGSNVGECRGGIIYCINGEWSNCTGRTLPSTEICDGKDNDCDGTVDDNCTIAEDTICQDGPIPDIGCYCEGDLHTAGYCLSGEWFENLPEEFPWYYLIISGVVILVGGAAYSHTKSGEKEKKEVIWDELE